MYNASHHATPAELAVIRFACPRCKSVVERADQEAGAKFNCPGCGQRLQVPGSSNKASTGGANWDWVGGAVGVAPMADAPVPADVQLRLVRGREHVTWPCPMCQAQVSVAVDLGQITVRCPQCTKRIDVPSVRGVPRGDAGQQIKASLPQSAPAAPALEGPALEPEVLPLSEPPRRRPAAEERWDDDRYDDRPRRRRSRYDDDSELGIRRYTAAGRPGSEDECARSSTTGFLCSIIGIALLFVAAILWMLMVAEGPRGGDSSPFVFLILFIGIISFVLGLIGVIFSGRGLDPINQRNRGIAVAGLVCGIIGMVVGLIGSVFLFCAGLVLMSRPF